MARANDDGGGRPRRPLRHRTAGRRGGDVRIELHEHAPEPSRELRGHPVLPAGRGQLLPTRHRPELHLPHHGRLHAVVAAAGTLVAAFLTGSWREPVDAWTGDAEALGAIQPLLLRGGVAGLAWRRLRATGL